MPTLPSPDDYPDWQAYSRALLLALSDSDTLAEIVGDSANYPVGGGGGGTDPEPPAEPTPIPDGYLPVWLNELEAELYLGNEAGTVPDAGALFNIDTQNLADAAVETNQLADLAVQQVKIADLAVGSVDWRPPSCHRQDRRAGGQRGQDRQPRGLECEDREPGSWGGPHPVSRGSDSEDRRPCCHQRQDGNAVGWQREHRRPQRDLC